MALAMHPIAFVLAALACVGHAWRAQSSAEERKSSPWAERGKPEDEIGTGTFDSMKALAMLLMRSKPAAGFAPGAGAGFPLRNTALGGSGQPGKGMWNRWVHRAALASMSDGVQEGQTADSARTDFARHHLGRRKLAEYAAAAAAAGLVPPKPSFALKPDQLYDIEIPESFNIKKRIDYPDAFEGQVMLEAEDPAAGVELELDFIPFEYGKTVRCNASKVNDFKLYAIDQRDFEKFFFDKQQLRFDRKGSEEVQENLMDALQRISEVSVVAETQLYQRISPKVGAGTRYIRFEYLQARCSDKMEGEKCTGTLGPKRRVFATFTVGEVTGTVDGYPSVQSYLLFLTFSAPENADWEKLQPIAKEMGKSFQIAERTKLGKSVTQQASDFTNIY